MLCMVPFGCFAELADSVMKPVECHMNFVWLSLLVPTAHYYHLNCISFVIIDAHLYAHMPPFFSDAIS